MNAVRGGAAWGIVFVVGLVAFGLATVAAIVGTSVWPLALLSASSLAVALTRRWGAMIALPLAVLMLLWLVLATTLVTGVAHLPMVLVLSLVVALVGAGALVDAVRRRDASHARMPRLRDVLGFLPALSGSVVWGLTFLVGAFLPRAGVVSWVMQGDSANNVLYVREMIARGGLGIGANANPVPLASALMGAVIAPGRDALPVNLLVVHDIGSFAGLWAVTIAGSCVLAGVLVGLIVRRASGGRMLIGLAAAGASVLPLTWFVSGYSIEFGFFNTQVAFPIMISAIILALATHARPVLGLASQLMVATLALAVWSPLVLLPAALGLLIVIRDRRRLLQTSTRERVVLGLALLQVLVYVAILVVPSLLAVGSALAGSGGAFPFRKFMLPVLAFVTVVLALAAFVRQSRRTLADIVAVCVAAAAGLAALAVISGHPLGHWSYYPQKFSWIASTVILVLLVGVAAAAIARLVRPRSLQLSLSALVMASVTAFLGWVPASGMGYVAKSPTERILEAGYSGHGDDVTRIVSQLSDPRHPVILFRSGEPDEAAVDFWLLELQANSLDVKNFDLRMLAYYLNPRKVDDVCTAQRLIGAPLTVYTRDTGLAENVASVCDTDEIMVKDWVPR